jgi:hypothetical protein
MGQGHGWGFASLWDTALPFAQAVEASAPQHRGLWESMHRTARIPDALVAAAAALGRRFRLLVISEDWCGDAVNTVPVLARWTELAPNLELRMVRRDEHPALMDAYLTGTSRSIPVVIVLTEGMDEVGHWGPRPSELQAWAIEKKRAGAGKELYPEIRKWYAKDKGETTVREVLAVMRRWRAESLEPRA